MKIHAQKHKTWNNIPKIKCPKVIDKNKYKHTVTINNKSKYSNDKFNFFKMF